MSLFTSNLLPYLTFTSSMLIPSTHVFVSGYGFLFPLGHFTIIT